jgi:RND family efflux transporter MFP subunit
MKWSALVLLVGGVGCNQTAFEPPKAIPTEVVVARPTPRDVTDYEQFTGHTDAIKSVQIKARVTGYLLKKDFLDGQEVKKDDVLYEIDDRPYKAALESAEAMVAQGEAHRTRLAADFKRAFNLFQRATIGKQEYDLISSNLAESEAQLDAWKAQLENARLNMSFTKVQAPMAGQLSRTLVDPGNLIQQETTILNDIVSTAELYVYFDISVDEMERVSRVIEEGRVGGKDNKEVEVYVGTTDDADRYEEAMSHLRDLKDELNKLKKSLDEAEKKKATPDSEGQKKKLVADVKRKEETLAEAIKAMPKEFPYQGNVNFAENKLDAATGTLRVRGVIKNPAPESFLSPGLFVRVRLPIGDPHPALLIPDDSIGSDQGRSFVYVITPTDDVEYRPIELGAAYEGDAGRKMRAIRKGIEAGERFIQDAEALRRVRPGAKVKVLEPTAS